MTAIAFFVEFILLFFLSRVLTREISKILSVRILSFLFLPGIIVHELSHILVAAVMFVPVGEIEFTPKVTEGSVRLGSAAIGKTDPVRRAIIGLAPIVAGIAILLATAAFYAHSSYELVSLASLILFYAVFQIGNTMFSSTRDLEGLIETLVAGAVLGAIVYVFSVITGINIPQVAVPTVDIGSILSPLIMTFGIAILIDVVFILLLKSMLKT